MAIEVLAERGFTPSLRSLQRFVDRHYPPPRVRARRRGETPPGAQGQVDWSTWPQVPLPSRPEPQANARCEFDPPAAGASGASASR